MFYKCIYTAECEVNGANEKLTLAFSAQCTKKWIVLANDDANGG